MAVLTKLHHDPAEAHLVRYCSSSPRSSEGVKNDVAKITGNVQYAL